MRVRVRARSFACESGAGFEFRTSTGRIRGLHYMGLAQNDPFVAAQVEQTAPVEAADVSLSGTPAQVGEEVGADIGTTFFENFINAVVDSLVNKAHAAKANKLSRSFQGRGLGESFETNFESCLAATIVKSSWLHTTPVDMTQTDTNIPEAEINQHPVMQINLLYCLSYDASSLIMQAQLLYFRQGETNATYNRLYTYFSEPLSVQNDKAISQWSASSDALLRERMNEGTSEMMTMMDIDFFHRQRPDPKNRSVKICCYDAFNLNQVHWKGFVLRNEGQRIIFQNKMGIRVLQPVNHPGYEVRSHHGRKKFYQEQKCSFHKSNRLRFYRTAALVS
jgi:hypothetical protein